MKDELFAEIEKEDAYEIIDKKAEKISNSYNIVGELRNVIKEYRRAYISDIKQSKDFNSLCQTLMKIFKNIDKHRYIQNIDDIFLEFEVKCNEHLHPLLNVHNYEEYQENIKKIDFNAINKLENCAFSEDSRNKLTCFVNRIKLEINGLIEKMCQELMEKCSTTDELQDIKKKINSDSYVFNNVSIKEKLIELNDKVYIKEIELLLNKFDNIKEYELILKHINQIINKEQANKYKNILDYIMCKSYTLGLNKAKISYSNAKVYYKPLEEYRLFIYNVIDQELESGNEEKAKQILNGFGFTERKTYTCNPYKNINDLWYLF